MAKPNKKQPVATDLSVTRKVGRKKVTGTKTVKKSTTQRVIREGNKKLKVAKEISGTGPDVDIDKLDDESFAVNKKTGKSTWRQARDDMKSVGLRTDSIPNVPRRKGFTTSAEDYASSQERIRNSQISINVPGELNKTQHDTLNKVTEAFKNSKPGSDRAEMARRTAGRVLQLGSLDPNKVSHHPCQTPKCPAIVSTRHDDVICKGCLEQEGGDVAGKTYRDRPSEYQKSYPV
jgi:hypothetical protein